jgi:AraC-like DNA-binding protein
MVSDRKKKSDENNPVYAWVNLLAFTFLLFYISALFLLIFDNEKLLIHQMASWLFALMLVVQLFFLFFKPEILYGMKISHFIGKSPSSQIVINDNELVNYRTIIGDYFISHDDFLDADFRLQQFADQVGISKNRLSQIINQVYQQNFNQLINEKRIEIAIHRLVNEEWKNLTIEGIAQEVGFKSRTTFNKAFQEKTGITPSQFRKQVIRS